MHNNAKNEYKNSLWLDQASKSDKKTFFSTYSTTQIANSIMSVKTAYDLNQLLKELNLLNHDGTINYTLVDPNFVIEFNVISKKGERYCYKRWTEKGKVFIAFIVEQHILNKKDNMHNEEIENKIKFIIQEAMKIHGGDPIDYSDIYLDVFTVNLDINENQVLNLVRKLVEESNGEIVENTWFYFEFLGRRVQYTYDDEENCYKKYIGQIAIYEENSSSFGFDSNGPLKLDEYVVIESVEIVNNPFQNNYVLNSQVKGDSLHYYELDYSFSSIDQATEVLCEIQKKMIINMKYWSLRGYTFDDSEAEEDRNILNRIEEDRSPGGIVPGFR